MNRLKMLLLGVAVVAGTTGFSARRACADDWYYAPASYYVAPPVSYYYAPAYAPAYVPAPVVVSQPVVTGYYGGYYAPAPAYYYGAVPYRSWSFLGHSRYEYRVYTPFGVEKHKYKYDRGDGDFEYEYDFDD